MLKLVDVKTCCVSSEWEESRMVSVVRLTPTVGSAGHLDVHSGRFYTRDLHIERGVFLVCSNIEL